MNTPPSTVTVWESGRLVARPSSPSQGFAFGREQWIGAALLVMCVVVLTIFVCVLERDVNRSAMQRDELRSRAVAEAQCESSQPAEARGACLAIFNGDAVASVGHGSGSPDGATTPPNDVDTGARVSTASLPGLAGMQQ